MSDGVHLKFMELTSMAVQGIGEEMVEGVALEGRYFPIGFEFS